MVLMSVLTGRGRGRSLHQLLQTMGVKRRPIRYYHPTWSNLWRLTPKREVARDFLDFSRLLDLIFVAIRPI